MPAPSSDMNSFDAGMARSYLSRYFPLRHLDYILSRMTLGGLHIWVGNGKNGKSTFATIVSKALESLNTTRVSVQQLVRGQIAPEHKFILVEDGDDWDGTDHHLPAAPLLKLVEEGRVILLITRTLPIITTDNLDLLGELFTRTLVSRFKSQFVAPRPGAVEDPAQSKYIAETILPVRLMVEYIKNRLPTLDLLSSPPRRFKKEIEQLLLLAELSVEEEHEEEKVNSSISIILQHRNASRPDDLILIEVDPDSDGFIVTLTQNYIGSKCSRVLSYEALGFYLQMFFRAAEKDVEGYSHIQFNVPLFPSTSVSIYDAFDYVADNLGEQIGFLMADEWPCEVVKGPYLLRI